jgi:hypothetical protein
VEGGRREEHRGEAREARDYEKDVRDGELKMVEGQETHDDERK